MKNIRYITYFFYHEDGYYKDDNGYYSMACSTDASKKEKTWQQTLAYVNHCRENCWPKKEPINPKLVIGWECGRSFVVIDKRNAAIV